MSLVFFSFLSPHHHWICSRRCDSVACAIRSGSTSGHCSRSGSCGNEVVEQEVQLAFRFVVGGGYCVALWCS